MEIILNCVCLQTSEHPELNVTKRADWRSMKLSTCPHVAASTFNQKTRSFCFLPLLCKGKKVSEVPLWIPPPGAHRRWHCSMTRDSSRCYSSSQTNAVSPSPPASAKIVKLKSFRPTVLISPLPSYLKIKGLFIRYFHPISGSFESFKIKVFFPKRSNEVSGSWVCLEGWQGCSTPWEPRNVPQTIPEKRSLSFQKGTNNMLFDLMN